MYIENSAINTIDKKSIRLNRLMLNKNIILEQNDYRKILIILDKNLELLIDDLKFSVSNQVCFIKENQKCELIFNNNIIEMFYIEFKSKENLFFIDTISFLDINEEVLRYYSCIEELYSNKISNPQILSHILAYFVMLYNSACMSNKKTNYCPEIVNNIKDYLENNFNSKIKIKDLTSNFYISRSELFYIFKKYTNSTIIGYLNTLRINKAKELLKDTNYSITEISQLVGFDSVQYFSRVFKKSIGNSPSKFRKALFKRFNTFYIEKGGEKYENIKKYSTF